MKKMLKIMAMLLVIATVIFAAGCADKTEETAPAEEEATEQVNESTDAANPNIEGQTGADEAPNMTENMTDVNITENMTDVNITENMTDVNITENITDENITNETK